MKWDFRYEPKGCLPIFFSMFSDMMEEMEAGKASMVLPMPDRAKEPRVTFAYWLALNAMVYGMRKGAALAGAELSFRESEEGLRSYRDR